MEANPIKNVSLSFACEKNWNEMQQVAGGRFCDSCQHVVHDFTNQSDCQLKKILQQNTRVCGRFKSSQMGTHFLKYAAVTVIAAASGVTTNSCAEKEISPDFSTENVPNSSQLDEVNVLSDTVEFYTTGIIFIDPEELKDIEADSTDSHTKEK